MAKSDPTPIFLEFNDGRPVVQSISPGKTIIPEPDWIDAFLGDRELRPRTKQTYTRHLRQFQAWLKNTDTTWVDVSDGDVTRYKTYLKTLGKANGDGSPLAPASINQALAAIQSFFKWLARKRYIQYNPTLSVEKLTEPPTEVKDLEVSVVQQLEAMLPYRGERYFRDRAIFEVLKHGLRANEIASRVIGDYANHAISIVDAKWGSDGIVPLSSTACEALDSYLGWCLQQGFATHAEAPLFISLSNRNRGQRLGYKGIYDCIKDLAKLAELEENIHPHRLRHTFGTQLILDGMNPEFVRRLMRIKSMDVFERYTRRALEHKAYDSFYDTIETSHSGLFCGKASSPESEGCL